MNIDNFIKQLYYINGINPELNCGVYRRVSLIGIGSGFLLFSGSDLDIYLPM